MNNLIESYKLIKQAETNMRKLVTDSFTVIELIDAGLTTEAVFKHRAEVGSIMSFKEAKEYVDSVSVDRLLCINKPL